MVKHILSKLSVIVSHTESEFPILLPSDVVKRIYISKPFPIKNFAIISLGVRRVELCFALYRLSTARVSAKFN